eukprot:scaffold158407_cov24-Tisochrysis_lutea.AAC.4
MRAGSAGLVGVSAASTRATTTPLSWSSWRSPRGDTSRNNGRWSGSAGRPLAVPSAASATARAISEGGGSVTSVCKSCSQGPTPRTVATADWASVATTSAAAALASIQPEARSAARALDMSAACAARPTRGCLRTAPNETDGATDSPCRTSSRAAVISSSSMSSTASIGGGARPSTEEESIVSRATSRSVSSPRAMPSRSSALSASGNAALAPSSGPARPRGVGSAGPRSGGRRSSVCSGISASNPSADSPASRRSRTSATSGHIEQLERVERAECCRATREVRARLEKPLRGVSLTSEAAALWPTRAGTPHAAHPTQRARIQAAHPGGEAQCGDAAGAGTAGVAAARTRAARKPQANSLRRRRGRRALRQGAGSPAVEAVRASEVARHLRAPAVRATASELPTRCRCQLVPPAHSLHPTAQAQSAVRSPPGVRDAYAVARASGRSSWLTSHCDQCRRRAHRPRRPHGRLRRARLVRSA